MNKSDYNLDIEKEKLRVLELSEKLLLNKEEDKITNEEVNELYKLVKDNLGNMLKFFYYLNNFRTKH